MNTASWDLDELDRMVAEAEAKATRLDLDQLPAGWLRPDPAAAQEPITYGRVVKRPGAAPRLSAPHSVTVAILREARLAQKQGIISRAEARAFCGFPPRRWWRLGR